MGNPNDIVGRTVARVDYDYDSALRVHFTDGSMLYVSGTWHNDSTAGTEAALLGESDPKSWEESHDFYDIMRQRSLPDGVSTTP